MSKIRFNFSNSQVSEAAVQNGIKNLKGYRDELRRIYSELNYKSAEASIILPKDTSHLESVFNLSKEIDLSNLKFIFLVGIGGQNLGEQAIYKALTKDLNEFTRKSPVILFFDTLQNSKFELVRHLLDCGQIQSEEDFVINISSKSGGTTETITNSEILISILSSKFTNVKSRLVVTTSPGSKIDQQKGKYFDHVLYMPEKVGGRYSIFSTAGLFPLFAAGFNVRKLLEGANLAIKDGLFKEDSPALKSAIAIHENYLAGKNIKNHFFFIPELEYVGKWYRQLMGESIGKEKDLYGTTVNEGITPIVSVGSTDLHSMAQLFFGGPNDKLTTLIKLKLESKLSQQVNDLKLGNLVDGIEGKTISETMEAIYCGVRQAYIDNNLSFMEVELESVDELSIGYLLQIKMLEMMYLAKLMNLNAFDQPNVEDYKKITRGILIS